MSRTPTVDVVTVNFNSGEWLRRALRALAAARADRQLIQRVVVVDNASSDGSALDIEALGLPLVRINNEANLGYSAAANRGALGSRADYLLFLNPDTEIREGALVDMVDWMERPEHAAIGTCGAQLIDETGVVSRSCARFPRPSDFIAKSFGVDKVFPGVFPSWFMSEWDHATTREVDHVMGACALMRTEAFNALRGFDERFFLYLEDVDLSFRAKTSGWRTSYLADVKVLHKGGASTQRVRATSLYYQTQSRIRYSFKHFGLAQALVITAATLLVEPITRLVWAALNRSARDLGTTIWVTWRLWRTLPRMVS